ncbi:MAG TPA: ABC transporter permease [Vicinamibacterales bacterium]|nr:ABC transporter permease [Vicinamibacterales bacterium]
MAKIFDDLIRDLRHAVTLMRQSPALTVSAILSLALGIGGNTAIFSVMDALMLRPLPVRQPEQLVLIGGSFPYTTHQRLRDATPDSAPLAAVVRSDRYNVGIGGAPGTTPIIDGGPVRVALVSGNYFTTIGVGGGGGRLLNPSDDRPGAPAIAVISDDYWASRFQRSTDALGRQLVLGTTSYEIVGVAPRGFTGEWVGRPTDVWIPILWQPTVMSEIPMPNPGNVAVTSIGRVVPPASVAQIRAQWQTVLTDLRMAEAGPSVTPEQRAQIAADKIDLSPAARGFSLQRVSFSASLWILMATVGVVLLIACANVANLLLTRAEARRRELAVRFAIGASRWRLVRQLLVEALLLSAAGAVLGVVFAAWATAGLMAYVRSGPATNAAAILALDLNVSMDMRVLGFTAALCILSGLISGCAAALRGSSVTLAPALMGRGADSSRGARGRFGVGKALVVLQVAFALVLIGGALMLSRTVSNLVSQDLGFDRDRVLLVWSLPGQTGGRGAAAANFWQDTISRVAAIPGVSSVSASNQGVLTGSDFSTLGSGTGLRIEGEPVMPKGLPGLRSFVAPGFFQTMGIPMVMGRDFTEADGVNAPRAVVISNAMARHYFGERNPVGHRIWFPEDKAEPTTIIGVVGDFLIGGPREATRRPGYTYFSYRDAEAPRRLRSMMLAVRSNADLGDLSQRIRSILQGPPLSLPILRIDTVSEQLGDVLLQERLVATLSTVFGALALTLAALGLYGVIAFAVAQRTNEIGIRMALGATRAGVLRSTLRESFVLVAAGAAIGIPAMLMLTRLMTSRLFGVSPGDPVTVGGSVALLVAVSAAAAFIPARRASAVEPSIALRQD